MSLQDIKDKIAEAKNSGSQKGEADALAEAAVIHLSLGDCAEALSASKEARILYRNLGEAKLEADVVQTLAAALSASGELDEASREAYDALNIARKAGDAETVANAMAIATAMHYQSLVQDVSPDDMESDVFKEGVKELLGTADGAVKAFKKLKNSAGQAAALLGLSKAYLLADEPDKAKFAADMAYMLYNQAKEGNGFFDACICLVHAHMQRQDFASAMRYCNEAKDISMQFQDAPSIAVALELSSTIRECTRKRNEKLHFKQLPMNMQKLSFR
jgi:tetratricopeptide (TPR) repeat protein